MGGLGVGSLTLLKPIMPTKLVYTILFIYRDVAYVPTALFRYKYNGAKNYISNSPIQSQLFNQPPDADKHVKYNS